MNICLVSGHDKFTTLFFHIKSIKAARERQYFKMYNTFPGCSKSSWPSDPSLGPLAPLLFHPSALCLSPHSLFCSSLLPLLFLQPSNPPSHLFTLACSAPFSLPTLSLALPHPSCFSNITRHFCCNFAVFLGRINDS